MALTFVDESLYRMGRHTFMWVSVLSIRFTSEFEDRELIANLIASPIYAHSYAWPFDPQDDRTEPTIHGPWWRDRITVDRFSPCSAGEAAEAVQRWADDQDWTDPDFQQPEDAQARLRNVKSLFARGYVYRLTNPGKEDWHEWGGVVGQMGFHEFAIIDRAESLILLVVAADD